MADNKPIAIRMDEETKSSLNEVSSQMGLSQGDTLKAILQNFKDSQDFLEDDTKDLEDILHYINGLSDKFREIIRSRSEATERAELKVSRQLETYLNTIDDLQKRLAASEEEIKGLKSTNEHLLKENKNYEAQSVSLTESRKLNDTLDRENKELREKLEKAESALQSSGSVSDENWKLREQISRLQYDLDKVREKQEKKDREIELKSKEIEELRSSTIQKIEEARRETRDELNQFYRDFLSLNTGEKKTGDIG